MPWSEARSCCMDSRLTSKRATCNAAAKRQCGAIEAGGENNVVSRIAGLCGTCAGWGASPSRSCRGGRTWCN
eukprot:2488025-Amphidinium_carterae.1